jgi:hypothetical protein
MLELVRPDSEWEKNKGVLENILLNEILSTSQVYMCCPPQAGQTCLHAGSCRGKSGWTSLLTTPFQGRHRFWATRTSNASATLCVSNTHEQ